MRIILFTFSLLMSMMNCNAQKTIELPQPDKNVSMSLYEALDRRASVREFSSKEISDALLSQILWAACGKNRSDGRITAPSALNAQDVMVYVCRKDGAFLYDAQNNTMIQVSNKDLRKAVAGRQDFASQAPVSLVLVSDLNKLPNANKVLGALDTGYVSENICLACVALGLATVPRATMDMRILSEELGLKENQVLMLNNPIGYPLK